MTENSQLMKHVAEVGLQNAHQLCKLKEEIVTVNVYIQNENCSDKKALQEKAMISFRLWALVTSNQTSFNINTHGKT